jgi:hypothetical protein
MTYIESRVFADEVLADVSRELNYRANALVGSVFTRKHHPTYVSVRALKDQILELHGAASLARAVYGGVIPEELDAKIRAAIAEATDAVKR